MKLELQLSQRHGESHYDICIYGDTTLYIQLVTEVIPFTLYSIRRECLMLSIRPWTLAWTPAKSGQGIMPYDNWMQVPLCLYKFKDTILKRSSNLYSQSCPCSDIQQSNFCQVQLWQESPFCFWIQIRDRIIILLCTLKSLRYQVK